jgi:hypothetical protein
LLEDPLYANEVQCRWTELRQSILSDSALVSYIDSTAAYLEGPASRHFQKWPILGTYVWPNNYVGQTFQQEISYLKTWIQNRAAWMDANMFGTCTADHKELLKQKIAVSPNPTQNELFISGLTGTGALLIVDLSGKVVQSIPYQTKDIHIELQAYQNGVYFLVEPTLGIHEKIIKY